MAPYLAVMLLPLNDVGTSSASELGGGSLPVSWEKEGGGVWCMHGANTVCVLL